MRGKQAKVKRIFVLGPAGPNASGYRIGNLSHNHK